MTEVVRMDLNCDMGESFGPWPMGHDAEVMPYVTSANIACGGHAGDPMVMAATLRLAKQYGVSAGAHPGYADLQGFGRRVIPLSSAEIETMLLAQMGALYAIARREGVELSHVKPHGALYNLACKSVEVARAVVAAIAAFSEKLPIYCLPGSTLEAAAMDRGLTSVAEGFVDRAYEPNGQLADRKLQGAVHVSPDLCVRQALELAQGNVTCRDGSRLEVRVQTLCVHGDNPAAPAIAQAVREALTEAGYVFAAPNGS